MTIIRTLGAAALLGLVASVGGSPLTVMTGAAQGANAARPVISYATRTDVSQPVRKLPVHPPLPDQLGEIFRKPRKFLPNREGSIEADIVDGAVQGDVVQITTPTVLGSFDGVNNRNGVLPPDPSGAIGPNHYVQMVNLSFAIYNRSGALLYGPADNRTLWTGFGGPCSTRNDGDPVVLYDELADRWMMSQFALPNYPSGPFYQCIAVSQTPDPTGSWYRYEFTISQSKLNDYPKFGVWPDGYYMSVNQFKCNFVSCSWGGEGVVAFERSKMLLGQAARMVMFDLQSLDPNLGGMLPSDLDGSALPPANAPNIFAQMDDDAWGYSPDQLQLWQFHLDWTTPSSSTFTPVVALATASFNSDMCGYSRNCIAQPGGTKIDALSDRLMYRLQYRNFGTHQSLVTNHTVDVNGSDRAGIRWYELRNSGSGWNIFQQGTYTSSQDSHHRWVGSIAMNGIGDIALGYSITSTTLNPSVRVAGRLDGDAAGFMTQPEVTVVSGGGYQTHSSGRWGDYSQMTVDPVDDCTFWYTQEYYSATGSATWRTRIGSVKLRDCGSTGGDTIPPTTSITAPGNGATVSGTVLVTADASDAVGVTRVELYVDGVQVTPADTSAPYEWSWNTTGVANGTRTLVTKAYDAANNIGTSAPVTVTVNNVSSGITLAATGYKVKGLQKADLTWSGAAGTTVDVYRNNVLIVNTQNDGAYTDPINNKGSGTYAYKVCQAASTTTCSNQVTVTF
jgi:hypothetical protein